MLTPRKSSSYLTRLIDLLLDLLPLTMAARLFATGLMLLFVGVVLWIEGG